MRDKVILLIEEDAALAENIKQILSGFCLIVAANNKVAKDIASITPPWLIICDNNTRDHDGSYLLKSLRAIFNLSQIPIIILTPLVGAKSTITNQDHSCVVFINKPFEPNGLLEAVQRLRTCDDLKKRNEAKHANLSGI